jgi:hypothetical protein
METLLNPAKPVLVVRVVPWTQTVSLRETARRWHSEMPGRIIAVASRRP